MFPRLEKAAEAVRQLNGVVDILRTMRSFELNAFICSSCLKAMWRMVAAGKGKNLHSDSRFSNISVMRLACMPS